MSGALQLALKASIQGNYTTVADLEGIGASINEKAEIDLTTGSGAFQADTLWSDTRTLAASASETLDLNGVLADAFGATVSLVRVKGILVQSHATNTNNVIVGAAASNPFINLLNATGTITLPPGAVFFAATPDATGWGVTPATGDLLKIANGGSGTGVTYDIIVVGAST